MVNKSNTAKSSDSSEERECVENPKILALISSLTALMMQVKQLADGGRYFFFYPPRIFLICRCSLLKKNLQRSVPFPFQERV